MTGQRNAALNGLDARSIQAYRAAATIEFAPSPPVDLAQIAEQARGALQVAPAIRSSRLVTLMDTPDQRLDRAGLRLEAESFPRAKRSKTSVINLKLRDLTGQDRAETRLERPSASPLPRFCDDLPEGPLKDLLRPIVEMRALLTWATLRLKDSQIALRDRNGKIRVRLSQGSGEIEVNGVRSQIPARVRVDPLKGYGANADAVAGRIRRDFGWAACEEDLMVGLRRIGMAVESVPLMQVNRKPRLITDADMEDTEPKVALETPAGPAMRHILGQLLDTIESRRDGVIADIDSEFLHEFRVAIRRSRTALQQLGDVLPAQAQGRMREDYRWLGAVTGPTRDLDVHILALQAQSRSVSPEQARILEPLGTHLKDSKARAHRTLVTDLNSTRYNAFITCCRTFLAADAQGWSDTDIKRHPISSVVGKQIERVYRKAVRQGARIGPDTEAEALHDLRKKLKKLRYLIEFIRDLVPKDRIRPFLKKLKTLQQVLGDVQDLEIQTEALHRFGHEMAQAGKANPDTLMAIGAWAEDLNRKRAAARVRFAEVFEPFADRETARAFRATFSPKPRPQAPHVGETAV